MSQAPTVRPTRPGRAAPRRHRLLTGATMMVLLGAPAAFAQQYGSVGSSVIVDYSVLDSLGGGGANLPGMLSTGRQAQGAPYGATSPQSSAPYGAPGPLLQPPAGTPRSRLTVPGSTTAGAGSSGAIQLIPPSELKKKTAAAPPPKPAPQPTEQAAVEPAAVEPTPPPPPTEIEAPATPIPPSPPEAAAPAPSAPAAAVPEPPAPEPPAPEPPVPEPPAMAQVAPAAEPEASEQAAAEPPPAPPPAESEAAPAAEPSESTLAAVDDVPQAPDADAVAENAGADTAAGAETGTDRAQAAALPSPAVAEGQVSVTFAEGTSELTAEGQASLDGVADRLRGDETLRVQLLAYAQAVDDNTSRARRMSLSRALAVRSYLIEKGVRSTRMDVRALGSNVVGEPADRVDIIPQAQ